MPCRKGEERLTSGPFQMVSVLAFTYLKKKVIYLMVVRVAVNRRDDNYTDNVKGKTMENKTREVFGD